MVEGLEASLAAKFGASFPHLNERQQRLMMGAEARAIGHGGIKLVARSAGVGVVTVSRGVRELESGEEPLGRVRRPGGGRKRLVDVDPGLRGALLGLVEPEERGDPMSPLRWTVKSTRQLAGELVRQGQRGHGRRPVARGGLQSAGQRQGPGGQAAPGPGRAVPLPQRAARDHGQPVISVDTKKKELVGQFKSSGRQWRPAGEPAKIDVHDFPDKELGPRARPN